METTEGLKATHPVRLVLEAAVALKEHLRTIKTDVVDHATADATEPTDRSVEFAALERLASALDGFELPGLLDPVPAIYDGEMANFETLVRAALAKDLGLVRTRRLSDGEIVSVLAARQEVDGQIEMVPLAVLFEGNPYELLVPPAALELAGAKGVVK